MTVNALTIDAAGTKAESGTASIVRALRLLDVFTGEKVVWGVSDIAREAQLPTSTTHRLLSHLVKGELITKEGTNYRLSERVFELGNHVAHSRPQGIRDVAGPFLGELFGATRLTVHLGILDGPQVLMVDKISGLKTYPSKSHVGGRYSIICTSLGKAMLAFRPEEEARNIIGRGMPRRTRFSLTRPADLLTELADVRRARLAFNREESTLGQYCIASPIMQDGSAVAAISVSGRPDEVDTPRNRTILLRAATQLSSALRSQRDVA